MWYKLSKIMFVLFLFYIGWFQALFFPIPRMPLILGAGMIIFLILHKIGTSQDISFVITIPVFIWLLFSIYLILTGAFVATTNNHLISSWVTYVQILAMIIFIINISASEKGNTFFIKTYLLYSLIYMFTMLFWGFEARDGRLSLAASSNANGDAITLLYGIFCLLFLFDSKKMSVFILSLGTGSLFVYTIIQTGSRKSFIAALLLIILWFALIFKDYWRSYPTSKKFLAILILGIGALLIKSQFWPAYQESAMYLRFTENRYTLAGDLARRGMYEEAIQFFYDNPLWGIGFNHFRVLSYYKTYSHSTYAEILSTTGLVGTFLYFSSYIVIIYNLIKLYFVKNATAVSIKAMQYLILMIVMLALGTGVIHFYNITDNIMFALMISFYYAERVKFDSMDQSARVIE